MIDYALAVACLSGHGDAVDRVLDATLSRLHPHPSRLVLFDNGRKAELERVLRERRLTTGTASAIYITGQKRRLSEVGALGRVWKDASAQTCPFALVMTDEYLLSRHVDVKDVAYVLESERNLLAMEFSPAYVRTPAAERRGSGSVPWLVSGTLHGWPMLVRTETLRAFPWPRRGFEELGNGMRSSLPGSTFGIWGVGDPWVALA